MNINYVSCRIDNIATNANNATYAFAGIVGLFSSLPATILTIPVLSIVFLLLLHRMSNDYNQWFQEFKALNPCEKGRVESLIKKHHINSRLYTLPFKFFAIAVTANILATQAPGLINHLFS